MLDPGRLREKWILCIDDNVFLPSRQVNKVVARKQNDKRRVQWVNDADGILSFWRSLSSIERKEIFVGATNAYLMCLACVLLVSSFSCRHLPLKITSTVFVH